VRGSDDDEHRKNFAMGERSLTVVVDNSSLSTEYPMLLYRAQYFLGVRKNESVQSTKNPIPGLETPEAHVFPWG
jgi:hypothetical protein